MSRAIRELIRSAVADTSYLVPVDDTMPEAFRAASRRLGDRIQMMLESSEAAPIRREIEQAFRSGQLDEFRRQSLLCILESSPRVRQFDQAAVHATEMESLSHRMDPSTSRPRLAAVARHRGVIEYSRGSMEAALGHFEISVSLHLTAENLGNALCVLAKAGRLDEAKEIVRDLGSELPMRPRGNELWEDLKGRIEQDRDLRDLREVVSE